MHNSMLDIVKLPDAATITTQLCTSDGSKCLHGACVLTGFFELEECYLV
jgi:hypothetical protein